MDKTIVKCTCGREENPVLGKGHIMGCALRTRMEAIAYFNYTQSLKRVQNSLQKFEKAVGNG